MSYPDRSYESVVQVEQVRLKGPGCLILTGPSSCGKGEVAAALCKLMSIETNRHFSMGEILRTSFTRAKADKAYRDLLKNKYKISNENNIFDCVDTTEKLSRKVKEHQKQLEAHFNRDKMEVFTSQLEWLEYCTTYGLLVPNRWTQNFIAASIEMCPGPKNTPIILDGYPRTVVAAEHLLEVLKSMNIPVIKVLHLSISKQEMIHRAMLRGRVDDDEEALTSRFNFYIDSVQPSVDYLKKELGSDAIALIDAHQPVYNDVDGKKVFQLKKSIGNVVSSSLRSLGVPRVVIKDLMATWSKGKQG